MASNDPTATAYRPGENLDYQPIAPMAVLAIGLAGLLTLIVVVLVTVGLYTHKPVIVWELLLLAAAGVAMSIIARLQIRNSEGTRTGLKLTVVAWWMSILGGVSYGAYVLAMEQAIRNQAKDFAEVWFSELSKTDQNGAFLLTVDPARRGNLNASDEAALKGQFGPTSLPMFRSNELVKLFGRSAKDLKWEFVGVKEWRPSKNGYEVSQVWRFTTPEGSFDVNLYLLGVEGKDSVSREWSVVPPPESSFTSFQRTTYGRLLLEVTQEGINFGRRWQEALMMLQSDVAFDLSLPPEQRPKNFDAARVARQGVSGSLSAVVSGAKFPPGQAAKFFRRTGRSGEPLSPEDELRFLKVWERGQILPAGALARGQEGTTNPSVQLTEDSIRILSPVDLGLGGSRNATARGYLVIVPTNPEIGKVLAEARKEGIANPKNSNTQPTSLLNDLPERGWQVKYLESDLDPLPTGGPGG